MRKKLSFDIYDWDEFRSSLITWASQYNVFAILDSNNDKIIHQKIDRYSSFDLIAGIGLLRSCGISYHPFNTLKNFVDSTFDWKFGHLSYDLKAFTEGITSENPDYIEFPIMFFFQPQWVLICKGSTAELHYPETTVDSEAERAINELLKANIQNLPVIQKRPLKCRLSKDDYIKNVIQLQKSIFRGDVYEVNYCLDFYEENYLFDPYSKFLRLNSYSAAPFSALY